MVFEEKRQYILFCILRCICIFAPGYLHPDEFFQSYEVIAKSFLKYNTYIPWEFADTIHPLRTIVSPFAITGLPWLVLRAGNAFAGLFGLNSEILMSPLLLLILPRLWLVLLSFACDYLVWKSGLGKKTLVVLASSWVMLIMYSRPLSNATESLILCWCLYLVKFNKPNTKNAAYFGAVAALGVFTRFTFLFMVPAMALYFISAPFRELDFKKSQSRKALYGSIMLIPSIAIGFISVSFLIALCDGLYFGHIEILLSAVNGAWISVNWRSSLDLLRLIHPVNWVNGGISLQINGPLWRIFTPLNFLEYNLNPMNLSVHGLHPRWLHVVVNMFLMFSLLYGVAVYKVCVQLLNWYRARKEPSASGTSTKQAKKNKKTGRDGKTLSKHYKWMLIGVIVSALVLLSSAPHQEARFLAPLLVPLIMLVGKSVYSSRVGFALWLVINLGSSVWFGLVHQGGVTPALCLGIPNSLDTDPCDGDKSICILSEGSKINRLELQCEDSIIFYHTHMPPRFLLKMEEISGLKGEASEISEVVGDVQSDYSTYGYRKSSQCVTRVIDLAGSSNDRLNHALSHALRSAATYRWKIAGERNGLKEHTESKYAILRLHIVAPGSVKKEVEKVLDKFSVDTGKDSGLVVSDVNITSLWKMHFSAEDAAMNLNELGLVMFTVMIRY